MNNTENYCTIPSRNKVNLRVKSFSLCLILILLPFLSTSCYMHTAVGYRFRHPDTDNYKYCLSANIYGAKGHAYSDETQKTIELNIIDNAGSNKLHKVYRITAADLRVKTQWEQANKFEVEFYDYAGAFEHHAKKAGIPITKRCILTLKFTYEPEKDVFEETQAIEHYNDESEIKNQYTDNRISISRYEWASWFHGEVVNYPPGCTFENQQYRLYFENQGPWRKWKWNSWTPYQKEASRTVKIGIWDNTQKWKWVGATGDDAGCKFKKEYQVIAARMDWDVEWDSLDNLVIQIYDYGDGGTYEKAKKDNLPKRPILLLRYAFDEKQDKFIEIEAKHLYQPPK